MLAEACTQLLVWTFRHIHRWNFVRLASLMMASEENHSISFVTFISILSCISASESFVTVAAGLT